MSEQDSFVIAVTGLAFEARIAAAKGVRTVCFAVPGRLAQAIETAANHPDCRGVISFGTSGGLDPHLCPGDWIVATAIVNGMTRYDADPEWTHILAQSLPRSVQGVFATASEPVTGVADKRNLRDATGALGVDMESHIAAGIAYRHGIAFAACRVIIDPASRALPACTRVAIHEDGRNAPGRLLAALVKHPSELWPLFRLALDAKRARAALIGGRRLLGARMGLPCR